MKPPGETIEPVLATERPTSATMSPRIEPLLITSPVRPLKRFIPARKSSLVIVPPAAYSAPTLTTAVDPK